MKIATGPRIYLSGPITGLSYDATVSYRDWYTSRIAKLAPEVCVMSPMRGKEYLADQAVLSKEYPNSVLSCAKGITTRDRNDVFNADVVIVHLLGATAVSIGTMIECGWADARRIPIILVIEEGNIHDHSILNEIAGYIVDSGELAIELALSLVSA